MTLNNSIQAVIDNRRLLVAQLRLRGATQREIVNTLAANGMANPKTGKAYSLGTVNSDLQYLESEWKQAAAEETAEHKARQMAENSEVRRVAWKGNDLAIILRSLQFEASLVGSEAPKRRELTGADGGPLQAEVTTEEISEEERARRVRAIVDETTAD